MSTSRFNPTESNYWSSPRLKIPIKAVNLDLNQNVGGSLPMAYGKSVSEPSSPQLWHKGTYILMLQKSGKKFTKNSHMKLYNFSNYKLGIEWFSFECQLENLVSRHPIG